MNCCDVVAPASTLAEVKVPESVTACPGQVWVPAGPGLAVVPQRTVALFSGIVWLSRDTMTASHIRFFLKSPGDSQFFAPLLAATELSPFSEFTIGGALIECSLKEAELAETA